MSGVTQLAYVGLGVRDTGALCNVLSQVLGMEDVSMPGSACASFRLDEYAWRVAVECSDLDDLTYTGWQVRDPSDLDEIGERARAHGVQVNVGSTEDCRARGVQRLCWFHDPDGLRTEIVFGPHVLSRPIRPSRSVSGFQAGRFGPGHIVISSSDQGRDEAFYKDVLGLVLSDYGSGALVFLRCNARHHSIALAPAYRTQAGKRLLHLMIEASELDDVGSGLDICIDQGIPLATTLGRHPNDRAVSFYIATSAGFEIEYACASQLVEDSSWLAQRYVTRDIWGHRTASDSPAPRGQGAVAERSAGASA
jgi:2,3-dihydroxybiphenyl 1,2-dioxygenase